MLFSLFSLIKQNKKMKSIKTMPPQQKYIKDKLEAQDRTLMQQKKQHKWRRRKAFFSSI
jgi:hypothetical protein